VARLAATSTIAEAVPETRRFGLPCKYAYGYPLRAARRSLRARAPIHESRAVVGTRKRALHAAHRSARGRRTAGHRGPRVDPQRAARGRVARKGGVACAHRRGGGRERTRGARNPRRQAGRRRWPPPKLCPTVSTLASRRLFARGSPGSPPRAERATSSAPLCGRWKRNPCSRSVVNLCTCHPPPQRRSRWSSPFARTVRSRRSPSKGR